MSSANNLKQIGLALHKFESANGFCLDGGGYPSPQFQSPPFPVINANSAGGASNGNFFLPWADPTLMGSKLQPGSAFFSILPYMEQQNAVTLPGSSNPVMPNYFRRPAMAYTVNPGQDSTYPNYFITNAGLNPWSKSDYCMNDPVIFSAYGACGARSPRSPASATASRT